MGSAVTWDPAQYAQFAGARLRPAIDLISQVALESPQHVCDLACGSGEVTPIIASRWPQAAVTGTDWSAVMLEVAAATRVADCLPDPAERRDTLPVPPVVHRRHKRTYGLTLRK